VKKLPDAESVGACHAMPTTSPSPSIVAALQNIVLMVNLFCVLLLGGSSLMSVITVADVCKIDEGMRYVYSLLPGFCLGMGLSAIGAVDTAPAFIANCRGTSVSPDVVFDAFDPDSAGRFIGYLAVETVVFLVVAILLDYATADPRVRKFFARDPSVADPPFVEDADVIAEAGRVQSLVGNGSTGARVGANDPAINAGSDVVVIAGLRKVYADRKVAVKSLSFGVQSGEIFGFLGINGAGESL
jgi:ATP-binding cassette, subfamily A (ABC1), member 3